jgi:hypothetical protein
MIEQLSKQQCYVYTRQQPMKEHIDTEQQLLMQYSMLLRGCYSIIVYSGIVS